MLVIAFISIISCIALYFISMAFTKLGDLFVGKFLKNVAALLLVVFAGAAVTGVVGQFDNNKSTSYENHDSETDAETGYEQSNSEDEDYEHPGYNYVDDYYRSDGTHVDGHWRSNPNEYEWDNLNP